MIALHASSMPEQIGLNISTEIIMKYSKKSIENARSFLLSHLSPGMTIYTKVNHVSRSRMSRSISAYYIEDNKPYNISYYVCILFGSSLDSHSAVPMSGCGMDMGFQLVYSLSRILYHSTGFTCIGKGCPSNDHFNGDRSYEPHTHSDAGYALRQSWL